MAGCTDGETVTDGDPKPWTRFLTPLFVEQELDLVDNLLDAAANKILFHPLQLATTVTSLHGLDPGTWCKCCGWFHPLIY